MNQTQKYGVAALAAGIFLIAFANVGLGMLGFVLTGTMLKEDFNSLTAWGYGSNTAGSATISPSGQTYFTATGRCSYETPYSASFPAQLTFEVKVCVDSWGGSNGEFYIWMQDGTYVHLLSIGATQCRVATPVGVPIEWYPCITNAGTWYTWTVTIDTSANKQMIYRAQGTSAAQTVGTCNYVYKPANGASKFMSFNEYVSTGTISSHIDSFYVDSGLKPPGSTPPPDEHGVIQVYGYADSVQVSGWTAYCVGPGGTTTTSTCTTGSVGVQFASLDVGSWTVYATYQGNPQTTQNPSNPVTVSSGQTTSVNVGWSGEVPPPQPDPWKWLSDFFKNPMFKAGMTGVGALLSMVGVFATIIPMVRKKQAPAYF